MGALLSSLALVHQSGANTNTTTNNTNASSGSGEGATNGGDEATGTPLIDFYIETRGVDGATPPYPPFPLHSPQLEARYHRRFNDDRFAHLLLGDVSYADVENLVNEQL